MKGRQRRGVCALSQEAGEAGDGLAIGDDLCHGALDDLLVDRAGVDRGAAEAGDLLELLGDGLGGREEDARLVLLAPAGRLLLRRLLPEVLRA